MIFLREKLVNGLGTLGIVLYYIAMLIIAALPIVALQLPIWADFLIIFALEALPIPFIDIVLWIWGLVVVLQHPISTFSIIYFVCFGVFVVIPYTVGLLSRNNY